MNTKHTVTALSIAMAMLAIGSTLGNSVPVSAQSNSTGRTVAQGTTGAYPHIGDCGFDRYDLPESGAAGYCYVAPMVALFATQDAQDVSVVEQVSEVSLITESPVVVENSNLGNPGNTKPVGTGEDPNGRSTMPADNAGGNGNGEHGNQGQNGNSGNVHP